MALAPLLPALGEAAVNSWWQGLVAQCRRPAAQRRSKSDETNADRAGTSSADTICALLPRLADNAGWKDKGRTLSEAFELRCGAQGLMTAYYEPVLTGTRQKNRPDQVALYAMPEGARQAMLARQPWLSRSEIEADPVLAGLQALVWLDDAVEAFFLHIQGSGRIKLRDTGEQLRLAYAGNNGQTYRAIGSVLLERGEMKAQDISAQSIKQWLRERLSGDEPARAQAQGLMQSNPRYVFFAMNGDSVNSAGGGPVGALGVPLVAMATVAADPKIYPLGSTLLLHTAQTGARLVQVQDVGSAIRGPGRLDMFAGTGDAAGDWAGRIKDPMQVFVLTPASNAGPAPLQLDMATALANCSAGK